MTEKQNRPDLLFGEIARLRNALFGRFVEDFGVTYSQAHVLSQLYQEDCLTQTRLSELLGVGTVTISGLVNRLEKRNLVKRKIDKRDKRANRVCLTNEARQMHENLKSNYYKVGDIGLKGLSDEQVASLDEMLNAVKLNLHKELNHQTAN